MEVRIQVSHSVIIELENILKSNKQSLIFTLRDHHSYKNPKFIENEKWGYSNHKTPEYLENFRYSKNKKYLILPRGIFKETIKTIKKFGLFPKVSDKTVLMPQVEYPWSKVKLRPEQVDFAKDMIKGVQGIGLAMTSFGKSLTCLEMIRHLKQPALIVVHTEFLQKQWIAEATKKELFNMPRSLIGGCGGVFRSKPRLSQLNVCLYHSLALPQYRDLFLNNVGVIIQDEGQKSPVDSIQHIINNSPSKYRFAVTANHRRKDGLEFLTEDAFGPILHKAEEKDSDSKILANIQFYRTNYSSIDYELDKNAVELLNNMAVDETRNRLILTRLQQRVKAGEQCLVLVQRKEQCFLLSSALKKLGFRVGVLAGNVSKKEITKFKYQMTKDEAKTYDYKKSYEDVKRLGELRELDVIIGTQKAEVGLSIRTLNYLMVATPISDIENRFNQMLGRVERSHGEELEKKFGKKPIPTCEVLWDVELSLSNKMRHLIQDFYGKRVKYIR